MERTEQEEEEMALNRKRGSSFLNQTDVENSNTNHKDSTHLLQKRPCYDLRVSAHITHLSGNNESTFNMNINNRVFSQNQTVTAESMEVSTAPPVYYSDINCSIQGLHLYPVVRRRCVRCLAGESGHINHVLG
ncbi:uncharacterized protein LOC106163098 isoform X1 [Lingula anatina]|uniref:Uncharacterized protein LOC106163098 isoform X1 n=2 Tax=Lingula anatina TaxID=7574 RepID=A0A1S3ICU8_LINAN|nr:uncharacterized protein LOC106163098 isoform X1 [Lingula anatina]|eukprot:XP_013396062.1 uncharacterized protein LOC106163098 isoform X1 [Lingula anatina]